MITLGVDVGTTRIKVLALDVESGDTLALESAPTPTQRHTDGQSHRPADVLDVTKTLLARVVDELPDLDQVAALTVASVGEEVVLIDADGQPLGEAIAWHDPRGLEEARAFMAGPGGEVALTKRWPPDQTFSLFKLQWMRDHQPDLYARAAVWTDLGDYLLHGLGAELVMDWSHASRAGRSTSAHTAGIRTPSTRPTWPSSFRAWCHPARSSALSSRPSRVPSGSMRGSPS